MVKYIADRQICSGSRQMPRRSGLNCVGRPGVEHVSMCGCRKTSEFLACAEWL